MPSEIYDTPEKIRQRLADLEWEMNQLLEQVRSGGTTGLRGPLYENRVETTRLKTELSRLERLNQPIANPAEARAKVNSYIALVRAERRAQAEAAKKQKKEGEETKGQEGAEDQKKLRTPVSKSVQAIATIIILIPIIAIILILAFR